MRHLFPTAYEAPRVRFTLVDGESGQKFPAWVVRQHRYVYGLADWYRTTRADARQPDPRPPRGKTRAK